MKVYLTDGTSFECGGYKALDSGGVVLTSDKKRKKVVGYVPAEALVYILPDEVAAERDRNERREEAAGETKVEEEEEGESEDEEEEGEEGEEEENEDKTESEEGEEEAESGSEESGEEEEEEGVEGEGATEVAEGEETQSESGSDSEAGEAAPGESSEAEEQADETAIGAGVEAGVEGVTKASPEETGTDHTHEDIVERVDHLESRVDGLDGRVDAMTEQLADIVPAVETVVEEERDPEDLRNIRGIGEAYATRLRASGIDTVSALRNAGDEDIAAAADVSERRVTDWKRRAESYAESTLVAEPDSESTDESTSGDEEDTDEVDDGESDTTGGGEPTDEGDPSSGTEF
ncbi:helix-hairpin-helix domain-containing protein [Haloferax profundi]|uniref:Helix-hairpin-helix domain-containing protein n=1 Tax=Haloferax profundi TaxID=1544718 RepID=A0A0W1SUY5_9EURY|nr:helix-hairpin-helix domain-containing protein [Haloferax profundi]KTG30264.1 hypothetical protein AUR66_08760 [Haloferax profundi]